MTVNAKSKDLKGPGHPWILSSYMHLSQTGSFTSKLNYIQHALLKKAGARKGGAETF